MSWTCWRGAIISSFDALYFTNTSLAGFFSVTFLLYSKSCDQLTAFQIFTLISTLNVIRFSVSVSMGETLHLLADAKVSLKRIQNFLQSVSSVKFQEMPKDSSNSGKDNPGFHNIFDQQLNFAALISRQSENSSSQGENASPCISLKNVCCSWNEKDGLRTLQNITMDIYTKHFVAITGTVGSGKSSLLQTILGELPQTTGEMKCYGSIAYCPQLPWVFSGTVRENITFGKPFDNVRYQTIVNACSLQKDFQQLPKGDLTNIGQRGVCLSGGQRARTCLARTLYTNADIILLDDPFSAVDARVANHLFSECIQGLLSEKCRVLVTHHHEFLTRADEIFVLSDGKVVEHGTYDFLLTKDVLSNPEVVQNEISKRSSGSFEHSERLTPLRRRSTSRSLQSRNEAIDLKENDEERKVGSVTWSLYWQYFRSAYPVIRLLCLFLLVLLAQGK